MDKASTGEERKTHSFPPRDPRLILAEEEGTPVPTHTVIPSNFRRGITLTGQESEWTVPVVVPVPAYQHIHEHAQERKQELLNRFNSGYVEDLHNHWHHDPEALKEYQGICLFKWELLYLDTYWHYDDYQVRKLYVEDIGAIHECEGPRPHKDCK